METTNTGKQFMPYVYDDGGRSRYFKPSHTDCVCRAITIASGKDYKEVYDAMYKAVGKSPRSSQNTRSTAFKKFMASMGFTWQALCSVGSKTAVHFYTDELPQTGRYACSVNGHYCAVIDGVIHDTTDGRINHYGQPRRVYGIWIYNGK